MLGRLGLLAVAPMRVVAAQVASEMFPWREQSDPRELSRPAIVDPNDDNLDKEPNRAGTQ
jgi:hypothetical protein